MEQWKWRDVQSLNARHTAGTKCHIQLGNALLLTLVVVLQELKHLLKHVFISYKHLI
ncbi:hypothetical protein RDABS01_032802 [Bienertia sinuspersici]